MEDKIKLLLVDDHAVVRAGLRILLETQPNLTIVGEAENGAEALAKCQELHPDVVLMDIAMPDMNGIEATRLVKQNCPNIAVLALTMHEGDQYFFEMLNAGASGYVPKRAASDDLVTAIQTVSRGEVFLYPSLAKMLVRDYLQRVDTGNQPVVFDDLTPREREVLTLIAEGLSNAEIAEKLVISIKTVGRHRENLMRKLNLHNRVELVKYAIDKGLID